MQPVAHGTISRNLPVPKCHNDLRTIPDTRRFAGIFPLDAPETVSTHSGDTTHEEQHGSDDLSRLEFVAAFDENAFTSQVASTASMDQSSTPSAAQQIIACYRAVHGSDRAPECAPPMETGEKELPQIPDDRRSMYTLAASVDTQSTMDMMWRPKPKVHMRRADQQALMQAQSQAIVMMHNAGLKPTDKVQCRRRGCADVLPDVEALKYHLHIHNIAESDARHSGASPSTARKLPVAESSTSNSEAPKRDHSRSKSSLGTRRKCSTTSPLPRKLSAGSLLPPLFSPRESSLGVPQAPTLTTVAKALNPGPSLSKPATLLPVRNDETPSTHTSIPSRGRRKRKESMAVSVSTGYSPSIAMLLSPPSLPIRHDRLVLTPHAKWSMPAALCPGTDSESDNCVSIPKDGAHPVSTQLMGSRSPTRTLSPTRAMSPIRNGFKRILSIGSPDSVSDK